MEDSIFQYAAVDLQRPLPQRCRGRAQRLQPAKQPCHTPLCKASREGEVRLTNSMAGAATRTWFKQLRRLQSLKHAVAAAKSTPAAITYRLELWQAIRCSSGFFPDFPTWWNQQTHQVEGVPDCLPLTVPQESVVVQAIYDSFHLHFRSFEAWHLNERSRCLKLKYAGSLEAIYADLRSDPRQGITNIWKEVKYTILAIDHEGCQLHLDKCVQEQF